MPFTQCVHRIVFFKPHLVCAVVFGCPQQKDAYHGILPLFDLYEGTPNWQYFVQVPGCLKVVTGLCSVSKEVSLVRTTVLFYMFVHVKEGFLRCHLSTLANTFKTRFEVVGLVPHSYSLACLSATKLIRFKINYVMTWHNCSRTNEQLVVF